VTNKTNEKGHLSNMREMKRLFSRTSTPGGQGNIEEQSKRCYMPVNQTQENLSGRKRGGEREKKLVPLREERTNSVGDEKYEGRGASNLKGKKKNLRKF